MGDKITSNGGSRDSGLASAEQAGGVLPLDPAEFGELLKGQTEGLLRQRIAGLAEIQTAASSRHSIVIVDDHVDVRELLTLRLAMVPGVVLVGQAANGSDALELARASSPDLMILDLRMPVMGGAEAIPLLRAVAPKMRIVVYTSDVEGADLSGGSRPDAVVLKGANLGQLVDVILGVLAEGPQDVLSVDLGRLPVDVAVAAFDSWVGLNTRVRQALATKGDVSTERHPHTLQWGFAVEYSVPYLQSFVQDIGFREPFNRLIPVVEFAMLTALDRGASGTTGTVNPGLIWAGRYAQLAVEAVIPANNRSGDRVGAITQLHFFLDDLFPTTIGRPIVGR